MPARLVVLRTYPNVVTAALDRGVLEQAGIPALVSADDCGGMRPELQFSGGVRLLVNEEDLQQALQVLDVRSDDLDD
jgi:hypothetical protein